MKKLSIYFLLFLGTNVFAQESITFQKPSSEILALADFQRPPSVSLSPDKSWVLLSYRPTYKTLEELGQEEIRLAGLRINAKTRISSTENYFHNIRIRSAQDGKEYDIAGLPANALISNISFSLDSKYIAFTHTNDSGVSLWLLDIAAKSAKQLTDYDLNAVLNDPYQWLRNSQGFLISKSPANRPALIDHSKDLPTGPVVSTSEGKVSQLRTYQDLLKNPQDEQDFVSLATAELYWIDLQGQQTKFLSADLYTQANVSPDGKYVLVSKLKKPFSYVVAYNSFPQEANVYAIDGSLEQKVNETPLMEIMSKGFSSTRPGKRMLTWRADKPNTLFFVQALDGGDDSKAADFRDELFTWEYPFSAEPKSFTKVIDRFAGIIWGNDTYALVSSSWYDTRNSKSFVLNPTTGDARLLIDRNSQDVYSHLEAVHRERNQFGTFSMFLNKDKTY